MKPTTTSRMKFICILFATVIFCSCLQAEQGEALSQHIPADSIGKSSLQDTIEKPATQTAMLTDHEWNIRQDSFRNEILKQRENKILRESFLQEMYIRDIARVVKDTVSVSISFDLHGPDCGAPDCYSTEVSFSLKIGSALIFPKDLPFREHEHGCVEKETRLNGNFQLVEQTAKHVIYHSAKYRRTLVLFSSNKEEGTGAFYFTGAGRNSVTGKNLYQIINDYDEEDKNSIYPFTSWALTTNEYENFLHK